MFFIKLRSLVQLNGLIQLFNAFKTILHEDTAIDRLQYQKYKTLHYPLKVYLFGLYFNFGKYQKLCPLLRFLKNLE